MGTRDELLHPRVLPRRRIHGYIIVKKDRCSAGAENREGDHTHVRLGWHEVGYRVLMVTSTRKIEDIGRIR